MDRLFVPRLVPARPGLALRRPDSAATAPAEAAAAAPATVERSQRRPTLSCVLPCRNEARNLERLLPRLLAILHACSPRWEIVIVDDGSTDATPALLERWSEVDGVTAIQLSRNFGKEAALTAGLQAAAGEVVVTMDADLQHPPELIPSLLDAWRRGADAAYAARSSRRDESWPKRIGSRAFYALMNAADRFEVPSAAGDFRLMDRKVVDTLLSLPERNRFMKGLYAWVGYTAVGVPYMPAARVHGRSHFGAWRLLRLSIDGLTAFTTWPLRVVSATGVVLAAMAFFYSLYLVGSYLLYGHQVSGWTTIVVSLMLFSGLQLVSLGIVGEYVGRIFEEAKARPLFVVKRTLGRGLEATAS